MEAFRRNLSTVAAMEDWDVVYKQVSTWDTDDVVGWIRGTYVVINGNMNSKNGY